MRQSGLYAYGLYRSVENGLTPSHFGFGVSSWDARLYDFLFSFNPIPYGLQLNPFFGYGTAKVLPSLRTFLSASAIGHAYNSFGRGGFMQLFL